MRNFSVLGDAGIVVRIHKIAPSLSYYRDSNGFWAVQNLHATSHANGFLKAPRCIPEFFDCGSFSEDLGAKWPAVPGGCSPGPRAMSRLLEEARLAALPARNNYIFNDILEFGAIPA